MKSLKSYIQECDGGAAPSGNASSGNSTPANTMGMGNPMFPGENGEPGSGDTFPTRRGRRQKKTKQQWKRIEKEMDKQ